MGKSRIQGTGNHNAKGKVINMKTTNILLIILIVIVAISAIGLLLSIIGAITGIIWRFIFSPLGVIALIILVIYLLKTRR